ncbi:MAG: sortase [Patescibacteria group bacterium]|nr:sortase [Patescibacteria group bacterium]MDE1965885.1 sortase [Patescibacteria group bacterium]
MQEKTVRARLSEAVEDAYARKWSFLAAFLLVFFGSFSALLSVDFIPESAEPAPAQAAQSAVQPTVTLSASPLVAAAAPAAGAAAATQDAPAAQYVPQYGELPVSMTIPAINLTAMIANPSTTAIDTLDADLLHGAVRYPTSAPLGVDGNIILFGHSSYLPIVHNLAYKTFDGIQNLKAGDRITLYSADTTYVYSVRSVSKESSTDAAIPLSVTGKVLTLSTCNSFGAKTDRFVVAADFVESHPNGA